MSSISEKKTNVFESRSGEVYSIQHYVITSEQYNSVENQKIILSSVYSKDNSLIQTYNTTSISSLESNGMFT